MTISITSTDVRGIYQRAPDSLDLTPMIDAASVIVNENLVGLGMTDTRLKLIMKYLAAHFAQISLYSEVKYEEVERTRNEYAFKPDDGLGATRFGQQAIFLDTSGTLAQANGNQPKAHFSLIKSNQQQGFYSVYRILAAQFTG